MIQRRNTMCYLHHRAEADVSRFRRQKKYKKMHNLQRRIGSANLFIESVDYWIKSVNQLGRFWIPKFSNLIASDRVYGNVINLVKGKPFKLKVYDKWYTEWTVLPVEEISGCSKSG